LHCHFQSHRLVFCRHANVRQHDQDAQLRGDERLDRLALTRLGERRAFVRPGRAVMLPSCASWFREPTADTPPTPLLQGDVGVRVLRSPVQFRQLRTASLSALPY